MARSSQPEATRSVLRRSHLLHTPESFVRTPLPGLNGGLAIVHASPELGAGFCWMTVELEAGGSLAAGEHSRFFYLLEGAGVVSGGLEQRLVAGDYAFSPAHARLRLAAESRLRCVVIDKRFEAVEGAPDPFAFAGSEGALTPAPLEPGSAVEVREMMPLGPAYDFAVNTLTYPAGASLQQVEVHYMEHGLLMLEGAGPYRLDETTYPVRAGDFLWMAPYCPQWFAADADGAAKYLIYKNWNRMPKL
jgi:(S)-ureidoglycine aminohydrolase